MKIWRKLGPVPEVVSVLFNQAEKLIRSEIGSSKRRQRRSEFAAAARAVLRRYPVNIEAEKKPGAVCVCPITGCRAPLKKWGVARRHFASGHMGLSGLDYVAGSEKWRRVYGDTCPLCEVQFGVKTFRTVHDFDPVHSKGKKIIEANPMSAKGVEQHLRALHKVNRLSEHVIDGMTRKFYAQNAPKGEVT